MEAKLTEFNEALCDVRKAHRLIYSYQQRMIDLAYFIKTKLDLPTFLGKKLFCNDISTRNYSTNRAYVYVSKGMWAWDFLYSNMYEYYLGQKAANSGDSYALSLIQYSDTGYFENEEKDKTNIKAFADETDSGSKLLFILELKPQQVKEWLWNIDEIVENKEYASINHKKTILRLEDGITQVLYSFPLDRFLTEDSTITALQEFVDYCKENNVVELKIV